MKNERELNFFLENGYFHAKGVLDAAHLSRIQEEFDSAWEIETPPLNQHKLLKRKAFVELIEAPEILGRQQAVFGGQTQLLQYDLLRQGPRNETFPLRSWHRDFAFPGDHPISINTILYLDKMTDERGPTYVVPGSHRGTAAPPVESTFSPIEGEVPVYAEPGDAVFINSAIWHTGSRNTSESPRRAIYLYYGYWWLKPYEATQTRPWQCLQNASEQRLRLLGMKMPANDLHQYDPNG